MKRSSRNRLNRRHLDLFPNDKLFDRIARTVCQAECLPRKELFEAWEAARRIHRRIKGRNILEIACGHALLSHIMLLLDSSIAGVTALDRKLPPSANKLSERMIESWPTLLGRISFQQSDLEEANVHREDLLVSIHACGSLTDRVIDLAIEHSASVALLPCCHDLKQSQTGQLEGWLEPTLAVDVTRVARLQAAGYNVWTGSIPAEITPKNRLLIATRE